MLKILFNSINFSILVALMVVHEIVYIRLGYHPVGFQSNFFKKGF